MPIYQRNKGDVWYVRYWVNGQKVEIAIGPDRRQAHLADISVKQQRALAKASGQPWTGLAKVQKARKGKTFAESFKDYLESGESTFKPSTIQTYRNYYNAHLSKEFGTLKVSQITKERLIKFQNDLRKNRTNVSVNNVMNLMRTILKRCVEDELISANPAEKIKRLREESPDIDPYTLDELNAALEKVDEYDRPIFVVLAWTGMRPGELKALKWTDINWERKEISISRGMFRKIESTTKTTSGKRIIKMHQFVEEVLKTVNDRQVKNMGGYIFTTKNGELLSHHLDRVWSRALRNAGIRHRSSYQLRHTWASMALEAGETPAWVAKMLGHSNLGTLYKHYAGFIPSEQNGQLIGQIGTIQPTQKPTQSA